MLKVGDIVLVPACESYSGYECTGTVAAYDAKHHVCEVVLHGQIVAWRKARLYKNSHIEPGTVCNLYENQVQKIGHSFDVIEFLTGYNLTLPALVQG